MAIAVLKPEDKITIYNVFKYIIHLYFFKQKKKKIGCSCNQS